MICGNCGASNAPDAQNCHSCGHDLASRLMVHETVCANHPGRIAVSTCSVCGLELCEVCERFVDGEVFCADCVERPDEEEAEPVREEHLEVRVLEAEPAHMLWRLAAGALDCLVLLVCGAALAALLSLVTGTAANPFDPRLPWFTGFWLAALAGVGIYFTGTIGVSGQTPGMAAFDLVVITLKGERVGRRLAAVRFCGMALSVLFVFGLLMPFWDRRRRMWHDKIAGTIVVKVE